MTEDLHTLQGASPSTGPGALPSLPASVSRRKALIGAVALASAPLASLPAHAAPSDPVALDTRLFKHCEKYHGIVAAIAALDRTNPGIDLEKIPGYLELESRRTISLYQITETPARTLAGIAAKAKVLLTSDVQEDLDSSEVISRSIAFDIRDLHNAGGING